MPRSVSELNDVHPINCGYVALVRSEYADWNWLYDDGYIRYNKGGEKMVYEHRLVAERAYGVPDGYHVHHDNEIKLQNQASNLVVLTPADHAELHKSKEHLFLICPVCETLFDTTAHHHVSRNRTYCSLGCLGIANRKVERPTREQLEKLMREIGSWRGLGRMFGVSDNAIRKWAKTYELDLSVCDGRTKHQVPSV